MTSSTMTKNQFYVDAMLCTYWRGLFSNDSGPLYIWADSSPQAGANWLLSMMLVIKDDALLLCAKAARDLAMSSVVAEAAETVADEYQDCARRRAEAGLVLVKGMTVHSQVPMAMGSGASSVEHTLRCLVQKTFVEASSLRTCGQMFRRIRGCCVDMGVEFQLADAHGLETLDLMPPWMRAAVEDEEQERREYCRRCERRGSRIVACVTFEPLRNDSCRGRRLGFAGQHKGRWRFRFGVFRGFDLDKRHPRTQWVAIC
jgi:hypothetical protein